MNSINEEELLIKAEKQIKDHYIKDILLNFDEFENLKDTKLKYQFAYTFFNMAKKKTDDYDIIVDTIQAIRPKIKSFGEINIYIYIRTVLSKKLETL